MPELRGDLAATGVDLREEDEGEGTFAGTLNFKLILPETVAVLGPSGGGRDRLGPVLAALRRPGRGSITVAGLDLVQSAEAVTGRRVAYVSQEANLAAGTVRDNLLYSLKHRPAREPDAAIPESRAKEIREARLSGNSEYDSNADWIDYAGAGVANPEALEARALEVLGVADMEEDVFELGLRGTGDPARAPGLASRILEARNALHERIGRSRSGSLVELFDRDAYNANMSVAENLVFGTPRAPAFAMDSLAENPYVQRVLEETGLMDRFLSIGASVAELMIELFADVGARKRNVRAFQLYRRRRSAALSGLARPLRRRRLPLSRRRRPRHVDLASLHVDSGAASPGAHRRRIPRRTLARAAGLRRRLR